MRHSGNVRAKRDITSSFWVNGGGANQLGFTISGMSPSIGEHSPSLEVVTFFQRGGWIVRRVQVFGLG